MMWQYAKYCRQNHGVNFDVSTHIIPLAGCMAIKPASASRTLCVMSPQVLDQ